MPSHYKFSLIIGLLATCCAQEAVSQELERPKELAVEPDYGVMDTPRRSGDGFTGAVDAGNFEVAAEFLDLRYLKGEARILDGPDLARRLDVIFQRAKWLDIKELVDDPGGRRDDGLPDYRDEIGTIMHEGDQIQLLMQRVPLEDGRLVWKVSNATVSQIPVLYATYGYSEFVESVRQAVPQGRFLGSEVFKWVLVLGVGLIVYVLVFVIALAVRYTLRDWSETIQNRIYRFLIGPFGLWAVVIGMIHLSSSLGRSETAATFSQKSPLAILCTLWLLFVTVNLCRDALATYLGRKGRTGTQALLRPAGNAAKLFLVIGALFIYMDKIGIDITTALAGLGIGGIAVALALQKPMEDIFAAITLYAQQPVRVGDYCRFGTTVGTVEEINLRTTFVRAQDNTLIFIPNSRLVNESIDNISARQKILYRPILRLRYDTAPAQLRSLMEGIRKLLTGHERVISDGQRVRFNEIADDGLNVEVFAYIDTQQWPEFLEIAEELNIQILEIIATAGASLSLPFGDFRGSQS